MKFQKTIDVWEKGIQKKIATGKLKVQRGQWMTCGKDNPKKCRFVRVNPRSGTLWVIHWQGSSSETEAAFRNAIEMFRR